MPASQAMTTGSRHARSNSFINASLLMLNQQDAGLQKWLAVLWAADLLPGRSDVSVGRVKGSEQRGAVRRADVGQRGQKVTLGGLLRPPLEDVGFHARKDVGAERVGTGKVLIAAVDDIP